MYIILKIKVKGKDYMYETRGSVYCYEGTNILVNKLNIKDSEELESY